MKHFICMVFGHRDRIVMRYPGFFVGDPDQFVIHKCDRCGMTWPGPALTEEEAAS